MTEKESIGEYVRLSPPVASVRDIKKRVMRRAWDGESRHTPAQMILLIQWRLGASNISAADRAILDDINQFQFSETPRSVLMLDAFAREAEKEQIREYGRVVEARIRFEYTPATVPPPPLLQ